MPRRIALLPALTAVASLGAFVGIAAAPAAAATVVPRPTGQVSSSQDTFTHALRVTGFAYDATKSSASITVRVYADGKFVGQARADRSSTAANKQRRITGKHAFVFSATGVPTATTVSVYSNGAYSPAKLRLVGSSRTSHHQPAASVRVIAVAKRYVHKARYAEGGTSPRTGFDCSGYTRYVFSVAKAGSLPRTAEQQRRAARVVSARSARAGDLVFYGAPAYHVAIYAGHGMQYAAATARDGIVYQAVWSSDVRYGRVG